MIVGIDLGTSTSEIAVLKNGVPTLVREIAGSSHGFLPSVVAIGTDGQLRVGEAATALLAVRPDASVAEHAYAMVQRYEDAQREFRIAISLGGTRGFEYGLALIEMVAGSSTLDAADQLLQELLKTTPSGSEAAAAYYSKQIELAVRMKRQAAIAGIVLRMTQGLETDEEKRLTAGALGNIASRLLASELFEAAERVARAAGALQPEDPGFDALEQAGHLLHRNDFGGVARLLRTHVSFALNGAVHGLRGWIERYIADHVIYTGMQPIWTAPSTFKVYGIGTTIFGERDHDEQTKSYVVTQYFTFFFIPLFPVANYRVREEHGAKYFLGRVGFRPGQKVHMWGVLILAFALVVFLAQAGGTASSEVDTTPHDSVMTAQGLPITLTAGADTTPWVTQYEGEISDTTQSITPVRSHMRLTLNEPKSSGAGYVTVVPPLTGTGPYAVRAHRDSVRLTTLAGDDTIFFIGKRTGSSGLGGTYGITGPGVKTKLFGNWEVRLLRGDPIPRVLNPW